MGELLPLAYSHPEIAGLDVASRRLALRELAVEHSPDEDLADLVSRTADHIDGYGPLSEVMGDPSITDVLVNGPRTVWIERDGSLEPTSLRFESEGELSDLIYRLLGDAGASVDATNPIGDARLSDGSRIHVVLPPAAPDGPLLSIRRFPRIPWSLDDLTGKGMLTGGQLELLRGLVAERRTIAISGGTGSGKTTLLNALLEVVPEGERVVLIEETPELRPRCAHSVALLTKGPNLEGRGAVTAGDLLRAALRMRPDRIVVGEVRGPEALVALQAMSTGHAGSMVTLHADSPRGAIERMTSLALQAGSGAGEASLEGLVRDCFQAIVHLEREGGSRRVIAIEHA